MQAGFGLRPSTAYLKRLQGGSGAHQGQGRLPAFLPCPRPRAAPGSAAAPGGGGKEGSSCAALAAPPGTAPEAPTGRSSPLPANGSCGGQCLEARTMHGALSPPPWGPQGVVPDASESGTGPTVPGWNNSRFGNLSHHSFFSRHNPHPHRVTHIQGLNGVPICMVNDGWSVLTPLSPHPMIKGQLSTTILGVPGAQMPIGDPHSNLVPRLTAEEPRRATQYSAETGRLIPPSSRATAHHTSQQLCRNNAKNKGKDAALSFQDQELVILELLCQILQTDSLSAIQQWLLTAGQREKDLVMKMLQTATANLQLEPQSLSTSMDKRLQSQMSQTAVGLSSRGQHLGRNHPARFFHKNYSIGCSQCDRTETFHLLRAGDMLDTLVCIYSSKKRERFIKQAIKLILSTYLAPLSPFQLV
uniref:Thymus, brain and testes associated n=1 Tax=Chrysemys picta bellii TaxID=8478 RepID=A0A8C3ISR6_CHRPI